MKKDIVKELRLETRDLVVKSDALIESSKKINDCLSRCVKLSEQLVKLTGEAEHK